MDPKESLLTGEGHSPLLRDPLPLKSGHQEPSPPPPPTLHGLQFSIGGIYKLKVEEGGVAVRGLRAGRLGKSLGDVVGFKQAFP